MIFDLINQLEKEIDTSPRPKLANGNKRVVDCDRLLDIIGDIKVSIPEEVRIAQNIYTERQQIKQAAEEEAAAMLALARKECEKLISRENVLAEARKRAQGIVERAERNSDLLADGARNYTDEILNDLQRYMREYISIIEKNRGELHAVYDPQPEKQPDELASAKQEPGEPQAPAAPSRMAPPKKDEPPKGDDMLFMPPVSKQTFAPPAQPPKQAEPGDLFGEKAVKVEAYETAADPEERPVKKSWFQRLMSKDGSVDDQVTLDEDAFSGGK